MQRADPATSDTPVRIAHGRRAALDPSEECRAVLAGLRSPLPTTNSAYFYDEDRSWIEMRLRALRPTTTAVPDDEPPLELDAVGDWPVYVSLAEARAFCRWNGTLPTEAEFHRAGCSTAEGGSRPFPWRDQTPEDRHGTFDFNQWSPTPVGSHPDGDSAWGAAEPVGNGWEWTATPFAPYPGFRADISTYHGTSANFFDDRHHVMLGTSWATPRALIRRSFRNWFQDHDPYARAKFRRVRND